MAYEEVFNRLFKTKDMDETIRQTGFNYIEAMFDDKTLTYEEMIVFIEKYKEELIECSLNDNSLIENLLFDGKEIDTTKKSKITKEHLEDLINKINNKEFEPEVVTFYLYLMKIHNLFANKYDEETLKEILSLNLVFILDNPSLLTKEGYRILENEKKLELTDKFLAWNKKCGKNILPYIFQLETLKEYITILLNSNQVKSNPDYQNKLSNLLSICEYSIIVRDTDIIPTPDEVEQINKIFKVYDLINKSIALDSIDKGEVRLVHFVREHEVDYQLVGEDIIDMSGNSNNSFDSDQSDFFIKSYYGHVVSTIEKETGKSFDINNPEMRRMLEEQIANYNNVINYRPLDRLPIKKREVGHSLRTYIRETDGRLSCSFIPGQTDEPKTHLDRKIGLMVRPTREAIISTSLGYTAEGNFYDFAKNSVPCTEIFSKLDSIKFVNETCVDATKCEVVGVLLLSDEKEMVERAEKIAASYNTQVIRLVKEKTDIQTKNTNN